MSKGYPDWQKSPYLEPLATGCAMITGNPSYRLIDAILLNRPPPSMFVGYSEFWHLRNLLVPNPDIRTLIIVSAPRILTCSLLLFVKQNRMKRLLMNHCRRPTTVSDTIKMIAWITVLISTLEVYHDPSNAFLRLKKAHLHLKLKDSLYQDGL